MGVVFLFGNNIHRPWPCCFFWGFFCIYMSVKEILFLFGNKIDLLRPCYTFFFVSACLPKKSEVLGATRSVFVTTPSRAKACDDIGGISQNTFAPLCKWSPRWPFVCLFYACMYSNTFDMLNKWDVLNLLVSCSPSRQSSKREQKVRKKSGQLLSARISTVIVFGQSLQETEVKKQPWQQRKRRAFWLSFSAFSSLGQPIFSTLTLSRVPKRACRWLRAGFEAAMICRLFFFCFCVFVFCFFRWLHLGLAYV